MKTNIQEILIESLRNDKSMSMSDKARFHRQITKDKAKNILEHAYNEYNTAITNESKNNIFLQRIKKMHEA